jgi:hypothetical protein
MHHEWPPLITAARQPRWMVWRDRGLTLGMWVLFVIVCHNFIRLALDGLREILGRPRRGPEWDFDDMWDPLRPFLVVAVLLVTWLLSAGVVSVRRVQRNLARPKPAPLGVAEEAAELGAEEADLAAWRGLRVSVVHLDELGRMRAEEK